jgi:GNAT superfamily N-acetyltransferase
MPKMVCATYYVGVVDGVKVCHIATAPRLDCNASRASRLVVMPEWQGAGVGLRFLNWVCNHEAEGNGRFGSRVKSVLFHTSHPGLVAALRRDKKWVQVSASLFGSDKAKSAKSIKKAGGFLAGYGGHFRSVQGFRYVGEPK